MNPPTLALLAALAAPGPAPVRPAYAPAFPTPSSASDVYALAPDGRVVPRAALYDALMRGRVICVGEKHDDAAQHLVEAEAVAEIADRDPSVVVGLEMVSQDQQAQLDGYMSGRVSEADFAAWWNANWGFDFSMYKPVFDAARARRLRVVGLNAPIALVAEVARKGLAALTPSQRARLPRRIEQSSDPRYRAFVAQALAGHNLPPDQMNDMLEAMAVWNETMGQKAAELARSSRVLVLAGQGHVLWSAGIPESARRRGAASTAVALPYPLDGQDRSAERELARLRDPKSDDLALADAFVLVVKQSGAQKTEARRP